MFKLELKSIYAEKFKALASTGAASLIGQRLLIEEIKVEELKTAGGLVLPSRVEGYAKSSQQMGLTHVGLVLLVGEDPWLRDSEGQNVRQVKIGDIVWVAEFGVRPCTNFPGMVDATDDSLQLTTTESIHMIFEGLEGYQKAMGALNGDRG